MLRVCLFGRFSARFGSEPVSLHDGSKAQELFVYLLLRRQHAHTREEIASLLWEDAAPERSKAYLRKALWQLHAALEPPAGMETPAPMLEVRGEWLRLHPDAAIWLDVAVLENAYARSRGTAGAGLQRSAAAELSDAVALYTGDLLPNRYQGWCLEERERIKQLYLCMLEKLVEFSEAHGEYELGLGHGRRILDYDVTREDIHRQLMRIHFLRGDRASALRQYRQCVQVLATELGIAPMRETQELYERIRSGDGAHPPPGGSTIPVSGSLQEVVDRLDHLQVVLDELRRSVEHAMRSSEPPGG